MAEINLTCPECATSYSLPHNAIPTQGRDVECSVCGHAWLALVPDSPDDSEKDGTASPATTVLRHAPDQQPRDRKDVTGSGDMPALHRRLPDDVLSILREEVEFEHQARRGEIPQEVPDDLDSDWPAMTITTPVEEPARPNPPRLTRPQIISPEEPEIFPAPPASENARPLPGARKSSDHAPETGQQPRARKSGRRGYLAGFSIALTGAAAALVLYVQAPGLTGSAPLGKELHEWRQKVDAGRRWLDERVATLLERE